MHFKRLFLLASTLLTLLAPPLAAQRGPAFLPTRRNDPISWGTFVTCVEYIQQWVGPKTPDWVFHSSVLSYSARKPLYDALGRPLLEADGTQRTTQVHQSGRIFFPPAWRVRGKARMPIVIYNHATTLTKDTVPSEFGGNEWIFGAAAAAYYGFAVAMPDQPGMGGDGANFHPYCQAKCLAYAIVDGIPAMRDQFREDPYLTQNDYLWDGRIFLLGYSEGGYASLAAAREMETHRKDFGGDLGFQLAGSACMAGPFDISGATRRQILDPSAAFGHPFFIPYVLLGYNSVYGEVMDPMAALSPALLRTGEDGNVLEWANGATDGLIVDGRIAKRLGVAQNHVILRNLLNPAWVARDLEDPGYQSSPLRAILEENDLAPGWTPTRPILFCQSPDDRDVPMENTRKTREILGEALMKAGREPQELLVVRPLGAKGCGISHVEGVFLAIPAAFDWIYQGMPTEWENKAQAPQRSE